MPEGDEEDDEEDDSSLMLGCTEALLGVLRRLGKLVPPTTVVSDPYAASLHQLSAVLQPAIDFQSGAIIGLQGSIVTIKDAVSSTGVESLTGKLSAIQGDMALLSDAQRDTAIALSGISGIIRDVDDCLKQVAVASGPVDRSSVPSTDIAAMLETIIKNQADTRGLLDKLVGTVDALSAKQDSLDERLGDTHLSINKKVRI